MFDDGDALNYAGNDVCPEATMTGSRQVRIAAIVALVFLQYRSWRVVAETAFRYLFEMHAELAGDMPWYSGR